MRVEGEEDLHFYLLSYFRLLLFDVCLFIAVLDILSLDVDDDSRSNLRECFQYSECSELCINLWAYIKVWLLCKSRSKATTFLRMCKWRKKFTMCSCNIDCVWALFCGIKFFASFWKWLPPAFDHLAPLQMELSSS